MAKHEHTVKGALGFTGTRHGLTQRQLISIKAALLGLRHLSEFHHGDCLGGDREAHELVRLLFPDVAIHGHPPKIPDQRAFCRVDQLWDEEDYLVRNQKIVDLSEVVIAAPHGLEKQNPRSGTWATIRMARRAHLPHLIIFSEGQFVPCIPKKLIELINFDRLHNLETLKLPIDYRI